MVIESSKDYGTGNVLMILDRETSLQEIADYLQKTHGEDICAGDRVEIENGNVCKGLSNPSTAYFIKSNAGNQGQLPRKGTNE